jgi:hypothetical protein
MRAEWRYAPTIRHWVLAEWTEAGEPATEYGTAAAGSLTAIPVQLRQRIAGTMLEQHGIRPPAAVFDGDPAEPVTLTCGACWAVSYDAGAASSRKCPSCGHAEGEAPAAAVVPALRVGDDQGAEAEAGGR